MGPDSLDGKGETHICNDVKKYAADVFYSPRAFEAMKADYLDTP